MEYTVSPPPGAVLSALCVRKEMSARGPLESCAWKREGFFVVTFVASTPLPSALEIKGVLLRCKLKLPREVRGTIFSRELAGWTPEDLKEELLVQVALVEALPTKFARENSGRFRLTFAGSLPKEVRLRCGLQLQVVLHVPRALRCDRCSQYGHRFRNDSGRLGYRDVFVYIKITRHCIKWIVLLHQRFDFGLIFASSR